MNRTIHRTSPTRSAIVVSISTALVIALLNFTSDGRGIARATVAIDCYTFQCDDLSAFPIAGSTYQSLDATSYPSSPIPIELVSLSLHSVPGITAAVPLPPPGSSAAMNSFFDVFAELSLGGPDTFPIDSFFDITYRIDFAGTGVYDTEMLSMVLEGHVGPPAAPIPVIIRESPTLASTGKHSVTPLAGGGFAVDSFFDVFTELSLDGGQSFLPASGPIHLELTAVTPEPATIALAILAASVCGLVAGRKRRHR